MNQLGWRVHVQVVTGFHIANWSTEMPGDRFQRLLDEVADMLAKGKLTVMSGKSFPLASAVEAVQEANKAARGGKVFLKG